MIFYYKSGYTTYKVQYRYAGKGVIAYDYKPVKGVRTESDYVVTYITHTWGGAAQYAKKARIQGKFIINLNDLGDNIAERT